LTKTRGIIDVNAKDEERLASIDVGQKNGAK